TPPPAAPPTPRRPRPPPAPCARRPPAAPKRTERPRRPRLSFLAMSFVSLAYLVLLPAVLLVSFLLHERAPLQNRFLLAFSLFCYGWWDWRSLPLLLGPILLDWFVGLRLAASGDVRVRRAWVAASVSANVAVLATFKYAGLLLGTLAPLLGRFRAAPPTL